MSRDQKIDGIKNQDQKDPRSETWCTFGRDGQGFILHNLRTNDLVFTW